MLHPVEIKAIGSIFGVALNYHSLLDSKLAEFNEPPYKSPPIKPVLFVKTPNTRNQHNGDVVFPEGVNRIQPGPAVGVVIGKKASRVKRESAYSYIAGLTIVNEFSLPEDSYYRPAIKAKCRDGFCSIGPKVVALSEIPDPNQLVLKLMVNGDLRQEGTTADWVRDIPQLISEITEFMTLNEGDVLITGTPAGRVDVRPGDRVDVKVSGLGVLTNTVMDERKGLRQ